MKSTSVSYIYTINITRWRIGGGLLGELWLIFDNLPAVLLAGCTSSSMANLYLTSTSYKSVSSTYNPEQVNPNLTQTFATIVDGAVLEVRVGYFGLCVSHAGGIWLCSNNPAGMASQFRPAQDPLNLIWAAAKFKDDIVFSGLLYVKPAHSFSY